MEVHHHAHTSRKKWTHYFWEFLMLFLAVFCGFTAENIREHQIEHKRTVLYANQFVEEIKLDTAQLNTGIDFTDQKKLSIDSLIHALSSEEWKAIYFWGLHADDYYVAKFHNAAFEQLKNSGYLRNFKDDKLMRSIQEYINLRENVEIVQNVLADYYNQILTPFINKNIDRQALLIKQHSDRLVFDSLWQKSPFPNRFLSEQKNTQVEFRNMLINIRTSYSLKQLYVLLKERSVELMSILQKEYDLK